MWRLFSTFFKQYLWLCCHRIDDLLPSLVFFLIINTVFYLLFGLDSAQFVLIVPGLLWVSALLAVVLLCERLYTDEAASDHLHDWILSDQSLPTIITAQLLAYHVSFFIPLCFFSMLFAYAFAVPSAAMVALIIGLFLGTLAMIFMGAVIRVLLVTLASSALIYPILALPIFIPILILGVSAVLAAMQGLSYLPYLALLTAMVLMLVTFTPFITAQLLRINVR